MNRESVVMSHVHGERWECAVGTRSYGGTREECLAYLCAEQEKLIEQAQEIHAVVTQNLFVELPCHGERRSS